MAEDSLTTDATSPPERAVGHPDPTSLDIAIVNANRDVELAQIEDAGKTRRTILRITLPPLVIFAVGTLYLLQHAALSLLAATVY